MQRRHAPHAHAHTEGAEDVDREDALERRGVTASRRWARPTIRIVDEVGEPSEPTIGLENSRSISASRATSPEWRTPCARFLDIATTASAAPRHADS